MPDSNMIFDIVVGTGVTALGWFSREIWSTVRDLKTDIYILRERLPREFVLKSDIETKLERIDQRLEKIFDKLEAKQDKNGSYVHRRECDK